MEKYIKSDDVHSTVLQMLSSDEYQKVLQSYGADDKDHREFRSGAMFCAAYTAIYVTNHAEAHYFQHICRCKDCLYRKFGHLVFAGVNCPEMRDEDFCSYGFPKALEDQLPEDWKNRLPEAAKKELFKLEVRDKVHDDAIGSATTTFESNITKEAF